MLKKCQLFRRILIRETLPAETICGLSSVNAEAAGPKPG